VLGFLFRLLFVVVLARLGLGLLRLVRGPRRQAPEPPAQGRQEMPRHLREEIVDGEFEDVQKDPER